MNDNNTPHYTELPIAQLEENKGQIEGLPANPRKVNKAKLDTLKESITNHTNTKQIKIKRYFKLTNC